MKSLFAASAVTLLAIAMPALAQTTSGAAGTGTGASSTGTMSSTGTTGVGAGTSPSNMPESMRIQQQATEQYNRERATTAQGTTTTEAPGGAGSSVPVERNRLDPAAPSDKRLQIDDGTSAAVRQNPDANVNTLHPSASGTTYNTIVRGSPSTSGTGATGSGTGVSGPGSVGTGAGSSAGSMGSSGASSGSSGGSSSGGGGGSH